LKRQISPFISLVVPVYNEEQVISIFLDTIASELCDLENKIEVVFINDGSTDNTLNVIVDQIVKIEFMSVRCINLSRNFGKEAAISAGLDEARGDVVVPMDVDLQDPPALVKEFLSKWAEGFDIVYGVRTSRNSDTAAKRATANVFYKLFNHVSSLEIPENVGDFRLMDRRVVNVIKQLPERNRFMKAIFAWVGFRSIGVSYERTSRSAGDTKWNYWKLWNFALDGITSFSTIPLRIWSYVGFMLSLGAFLYIVVIILKALFVGMEVPGYASLMSVVLFLGGIQLITLGIIGEYIGRLFIESKGRPVYVVENIYDKDMLVLEQ
jgi:glycosyltransferase involved in cell wall biosynthesis